MYAVANNAAIIDRSGQPERDATMIFTARFGALAARRTFPHIDEMDQVQTPDLPLTDNDTEKNTETDHATEPSAA